MKPGAGDRYRYMEVLSVDRPGNVPFDIAGFALDTPRIGERLRGDGFELNGWVIGRHQRVASVRFVDSDGTGRSAPVDISRPDVATDYPAFPAASSSGFSFWAPLLPESTHWHMDLDAVMDDGSLVRLARISGQTGEKPIVIPQGSRLVDSPDFVIIGAQRGGTTSLHAYLGAHPRIATAKTKELHFLTDRFERGRDWYAGQFPSTLPIGDLTGEATPYALFHPRSPRRLRQVAPDARLIVLLRNPIERAYSHYMHEHKSGFEHLAFEDALAAEPERLAGEEDRLASDPAYISFNHKHASYMARGDYARQVERWLAHFPAEQMLFLRSEDLFEHPESSLADITSFLGITEAKMSFPMHNRTSGPAIDPVVRERLRDRFAAPNRELNKLLEWNVRWE